MRPTIGLQLDCFRATYGILLLLPILSTVTALDSNEKQRSGSVWSPPHAELLHSDDVEGSGDGSSLMVSGVQKHGGTVVEQMSGFGPDDEDFIEGSGHHSISSGVQHSDDLESSGDYDWHRPVVVSQPFDHSTLWPVELTTTTTLRPAHTTPTLFQTHLVDEGKDDVDEDSSFVDEFPPTVGDRPTDPPTTTTIEAVPTTATPSSPGIYDAPKRTALDPFLRPGIVAAVIGGIVVGLLAAILLIMFIVYRLRKKDEGSYALDEPKHPPRYMYSYQKAPTKEFYA